MKRFKYIAILAALFMAVSCSETDVMEQTSMGNSKLVQIVGRVLPYTDCNVSSRAIKNGDETNIKSMTLVIFEENGSIADSHYITGSSPVFQVEREKLTNASEIYLFANVPDNNNAQSIDDFLNVQNAVPGIDIPDEGFPMMGKFVIEKNTDGTSIIPNILEISLSALYAKIVMNIEVRPDQSVEGQLPASFRLDGFTVHNVANTVDFKGNTDDSGNEVVTNDATPVLAEVFEGSIEGNNTAQGANSVQFSFYLPERFLQPNTTAANYPYPFKGTYDATTDKDQNGIRDEDENYRQRFKPLLVADNDPAATFVRFFGEYIDHQGHNYNVSYDIYVGSDNYGNFDVARNTQYNNYITIRGLANSNDQALNENAISIDHRVDVERVNPIIINFRRETLLDSHFEVRPLRIRKNPDFTGSVEGAKVKVEVVYNNTPASNWIGLERSFGDGNTVTTSNTYLVDSDLAADRKNAAGKRKYFTTDLTTNTLAGSVSGVTIPVTEEDQCVWIYVDECTEAADDVRSATIRVSYSVDGNTWDSNNQIEYTINQRKLFPVTFTDTNGTTRKYNIEYHEEYLYNYDAEDEYGQTEDEGMAWGLDNVQLSYDEEALIFTGGYFDFITDIVNYIKDQTIEPKYDFYIPKHDTEIPSDITKRAYSGYTFCNEIISDLKNTERDEDTSNDIGVLNLSEQPKSAVEYCFNKNKRNDDGTITTENVEWYLPAIDEIEDIVMSEYEGGNKTYTRFLEFQDKYYWSSQPSYIRNYAYYTGAWGLVSRTGSYYYDDVNHARATKVSYSQEKGYENILSGTNGYYHALIISGILSPSFEEKNTGSYNGISLGTIVRQSGNQPRTDKARIRCVKRITE